MPKLESFFSILHPYSAASRVSLLNSHKSQQAANVTFLLNNLLHHYDNSLRPDIGGGWLYVQYNNITALQRASVHY